MARRWKNETYLKVRRWVDRDLVAYPRNSIAFQGGFIVLIVLALAAYAGGIVTVVGFWGLIFPLGASWLGFVQWRVSRLSKAASLKGDRHYDQKGKYMLPPEYATTESVTAASRRKARSQQAKSQ